MYYIISCKAVFDMSKIQFWKQFTTVEYFLHNLSRLYSICQRYNFESNLQPHDKFKIFKTAVFDMSKIQFWKQFTTERMKYKRNNKLYSICQRYNFESNLQLRFSNHIHSHRCIRYVKDTILKAIYNRKKIWIRLL